MKRRLPIILALAVALAFAASGGPRHASAAAPNHGHAATAHDHAHHAPDSGHSHAAIASDFVEDSRHDHAGAPAFDQGCCYASCSSIAILHAVDGLLSAASHDNPVVFARPFRIAALSGAIDPPPR